MRILVGGLSHESNSFNPRQMRISDFSPRYGAEIPLHLSEIKPAPLHGICETIENWGAQVVQTIYARATPGGLVSLEAYREMKEGFLQKVRKADRLDGICLHLHGSMTVAGLGDGEGDLLVALRETVGEKIPIVSSLDMHASLTPAMLKTADAFVAYRTAPHVDTKETGARAARLLLKSLSGGYRLCQRAIGLPLLISGEQSESAKPPMLSLIQELVRLDQTPGILSSSILLGFPWVDMPCNQGAALVVTEENPELARTEALELAAKFWSRLAEFKFTTEAYPFAEALERALEIKEGPVYLADCGDNPGAGGSQNLVLPLRQMLERKLENILFGAVADQKAYELCLKHKLGEHFELTLGKLSTEPDAPGLSLEARLMAVGDLGQMPSAVIRTEGIDVIISKDRVMMLDPQDLEQLGLDPLQYRLLVLKSGYLDPKYEKIAGRGILALTEGFTNQTFGDLHYARIKRPVHPLDVFEYDPANYLLPHRETAL